MGFRVPAAHPHPEIPRVPPRAFNPSDFLKRIVTSNFRDMRKLMSVVFELFKNVVLDTEKRSAIIFGKAITPNVFEKKNT